VSRTRSFNYDQSYTPAAPFLPITVDGYDSEKQAVTVSAFVDNGYASVTEVHTLDDTNI
jgi:hypothetical protein